MKKGYEENNELSIDDDIASRIAALKGVPYKDYSKPDVSLLLSKQSKPEQEQINDLLKQFVEEKVINDEVKGENQDPIADIERRLAILKGQDPNAPKKNNIPIIEKEADEETEIKKIIEKVI